MDNLYIWLVVGQTPLKNMKVNWDDDIPRILKTRKWSKPPTSRYLWYLYGILTRYLWYLYGAFCWDQMGSHGIEWLPSGKRLHNEPDNCMTLPFLWEDSLFLWPCSLASLNCQRVSTIYISSTIILDT